MTTSETTQRYSCRTFFAENRLLILTGVAVAALLIGAVFANGSVFNPGDPPTATAASVQVDEPTEIWLADDDCPFMNNSSYSGQAVASFGGHPVKEETSSACLLPGIPC